MYRKQYWLLTECRTSIGVSLPEICHGTAHIIGFVAVQILDNQVRLLATWLMITIDRESFRSHFCGI